MQDKSDKVAWQWGSRGWMIHLSISAPHGMARQSARATAIGSGTVSVASAITWVAAWEERGGGGRVGAAATACPGHPDNQTGEKIAASVDPQGQRS